VSNPQKIEFQLTETPKLPLDIIHTDLYTINGKSKVTVIDKSSRFAAGYTIPTRDSLSVIKAIRSFMSSYGIPKNLICDQGAEYLLKLFSVFCRHYNIHVHITFFQQPSSNAPVERLHLTLTERYGIILEERRKQKSTCDHEDMLAEQFVTYNNSIHSATKLTPFELFTHIFLIKL